MHGEHALPCYAEAEIQFGANVWRRSTLLHEGMHRFSHTRKLDLSERHRRFRYHAECDAPSPNRRLAAAWLPRQKALSRTLDHARLEQQLSS